MHDRRHDRNQAESGAAEASLPPEPHDRRHDLNADAAPDDHAGERDPELSARSLAARREPPEVGEEVDPGEAED